MTWSCFTRCSWRRKLLIIIGPNLLVDRFSPLLDLSSRCVQLRLVAGCQFHFQPGPTRVGVPSRFDKSHLRVSRSFERKHHFGQPNSVRDQQDMLWRYHRPARLVPSTLILSMGQQNVGHDEMSQGFVRALPDLIQRLGVRCDLKRSMFFPWQVSGIKLASVPRCAFCFTKELLA